MYTKIIVFLLIFILISQKISNGNSNQKQNINVENSQNYSTGNSTLHKINKPKNNTNPWESDWSDIGQHFGGHQNSDDDGKCHFIHYERFLNRRNRNLYYLAGKLILLLGYLCSLFSAYAHLCH